MNVNKTNTPISIFAAVDPGIFVGITESIRRIIIPTPNVKSNNVDIIGKNLVTNFVKYEDKDAINAIINAIVIYKSYGITLYSSDPAVNFIIKGFALSNIPKINAKVSIKGNKKSKKKGLLKKAARGLREGCVAGVGYVILVIFV